MTAMAGTRKFSQKLSAEPRVLGYVRDVVNSHVHRWGYAEVVDATAMCATELVTNAQQHAGGGECVFHLEQLRSGVRVVVSDDSPELPTLSHPEWWSECGRGLWLLSHTANAWGVRATATGKDVWAELLCHRGQL